jgi:uncharacterized membrane protein YeaQ/YmgE (transglycosylase-associated protein family)
LDFVWCFLVGALIGWIASLLMRTATSKGILVDIGVGAAGGLLLPLALATSSMFDNFLASSLGAFLALTLLYILRRSRVTSKSQEN